MRGLHIWLSLIPLAAHAWDADGMAAIGMTTMSGVRGDALTQLKRLLGGKDVVDIAHWPKSVVNKYPELDAIFQQFQDRDPSRRVDCKYFDASENCRHGHCIARAAQYFYANLIGRPELAPQDFVMPVKLKLTDTDKMKFLIGVLAEMHSPSKFGYMFNRGGKDVVVTIPEGTKIKTATLYDYWDSELVQKVIRDRPNFWYSGWTHFNSLGRPFFDTQAQEWNAAKPEDRLAMFDKWAAGSFESSCERAQRRQPVLPNTTDISELDLLIPNHFANTAATLFMDFEFLKGKILLGGIRSSIVLNSILATREAKKLRQGTGVKVKAGTSTCRVTHQNKNRPT